MLLKQLYRFFNLSLNINKYGNICEWWMQLEGEAQEFLKKTCKLGFRNAHPMAYILNKKPQSAIYPILPWQNTGFLWLLLPGYDYLFLGTLDLWLNLFFPLSFSFFVFKKKKKVVVKERVLLIKAVRAV